ncbi:[FeFe] hydrogenase H-cluster maturation GTPase HydF [Spirochaetia bacterium]|nr:[FeFe] hydrogenase H-cluster maturation GTPase HydF [Spirochaetia bacterium]
MSMNETPSSERVHIGFFGRRNAGKSSLVNAVTGQDLVIVSEVKGTTTDPVSKSMELLPIGPVLIIDTPGIDDEGALGELRVRKAQKVLNKTDIAVLVVDASDSDGGGEKRPLLTEAENDLVRIFQAKKVPFLVAYNKSDLLSKLPEEGANEIFVSAQTGAGITALKERIAHIVRTDDPKLKIVGGLIKPGDTVVLVTPIDSAAPKGRLILPQQQTIRDVEEADGIAVVVTEKLFTAALNGLRHKPALVITDSQAFAKVSAETPLDVPLTSFSILFARYKGFLEAAVRGVKALDTIQDGDRVLVCEGCTHHRQCDDIGTVKLPRWISEYVSGGTAEKKIEFVFRSGGDFPDDLSGYKMIIHCGACMLNDREMQYRQKCADDQNIPFTNYGIAIAYMQGILKRSVAMLPEITV